MDLSAKRVLLSNLSIGVHGQVDVNCDGYGRVRRFSSYDLLLSDDDEPKPLLRGLKPALHYRTQVFQIAACNWRCWYCFVDDELLNGHQRAARFFNAGELFQLHLEDECPPNVIDLSGGQPDLVPEWTLWMLEQADALGLRGKRLFWIDDALSTNYLYDILSADQLKFIATFQGVSRACCLKGFSQASFEYNTGLPGNGLDKQLIILKKHVAIGFDVFVYVTFTDDPRDTVDRDIELFVGRLREIHPLLPLRVVPLRVHPFSGAIRRRPSAGIAMQNQFSVYRRWKSILLSIYGKEALDAPYESISLS